MYPANNDNNEDYYLQIQRNGGQSGYPPPNYQPAPNAYPSAYDTNAYPPPEYIGGQTSQPTYQQWPTITPQYSRPVAPPFNAIALGVSLLITLAAGLLLYYYTGVWWLIIVFPLVGLSGGLRKRSGGYGAAYIGSRLVMLLITLAIFASVFITLLCKLNGVF